MLRRIIPEAVHYEVQELLGEGASGKVFRALRVQSQGQLSQAVALKILHSQKAVDLWRQEFTSLARVRSSFCVQVLGFEKFDGLPALVLEHVDGLSLKNLLFQERLDTDLAIEIVAQIQQGLLDLNAQGICHGDLSPNNVLVDVSGRVRLVDFGLANVAENAMRATLLTLAPEVHDGGRPGFAADLFSLGVLAHLMRPDVTPASGIVSTLGTAVGRDFQTEQDPLLHPDPQQRRLLPHQPSLSRQQALAEVVQRVQSRLKLLKRATQSVRLVADSQRPQPNRKKYLQQIVLALFLLVSPLSQGGLRQARPAAQVSIRSLQWMQVQLDGLKPQYVPVDWIVPAPGSVKIRWRTAKAKGEKIIYVQRGQALVLKDLDRQQ